MTENEQFEQFKSACRKIAEMACAASWNGDPVTESDIANILREYWPWDEEDE